jgi:hypothetical protein
MLPPYYVRIKNNLKGFMHIENGDYPRKSIRFYREAPIPKPKPLFQVDHKNDIPTVQTSKRSELSAAGKRQFDKILNSQVSNFIFKNFPWDKTKKPREYWIEQDLVQDDVMQTGFESYNTWYKLYKTSDVVAQGNRSTALGGTSFWMLAINKLMSGGYHDPQFMPGLHLTELLRKIEEQYDE